MLNSFFMKTFTKIFLFLLLTSLFAPNLLLGMDSNFPSENSNGVKMPLPQNERFSCIATSNKSILAKKLTTKNASLSEKPPLKMSIEIMQKQFEAGFQSSSFLHDFAYALESHELPYYEVVNKYLQQVRKKKQLLTLKNQEFVFHFSENAQTDAFDILLQEKMIFSESYGLQNVERKIKNALFNSTLHAAFTQNDHLFKRIKQLTKKATLNDYSQFLYILESKYFEYLKDWKSYIKVTCNFMDKYEGSDPIFLNNQAISILKIKENKEILKRAKNWTEKSIFIDPQNYNYQTYAYILYKLGDLNAAKVANLKASKFNKRNYIEKKVTLPNDAETFKKRLYSKT